MCKHYFFFLLKTKESIIDILIKFICLKNTAFHGNYFLMRLSIQWQHDILCNRFENIINIWFNVIVHDIFYKKI